jgi:hypothetical protein
MNMLSIIAVLASLLPTSFAQSTSGNYSTSWESLPGALNAEWASCSSASWPPSTLGSPLVPQIPDAQLQAMLIEVSTDRIENIVTTLTNFGTRHTLSLQNPPPRHRCCTGLDLP